MFSPEVGLLYPPSTAPYPLFCCGSINDSILIQDVVFEGYDETPCANDTVRCYADCIVNSRTSAEGVEVTDGGAFDT